MGLRSGHRPWQVPERGNPAALDGALVANDLVGPDILFVDDVAGLQGRHRICSM